MTYNRNCDKGDTTGATNGAGTTYNSGARSSSPFITASVYPLVSSNFSYNIKIYRVDLTVGGIEITNVEVTCTDYICQM
jgi:hypothetical protein